LLWTANVFGSAQVYESEAMRHKIEREIAKHVDPRVTVDYDPAGAPLTKADFAALDTLRGS
jgi:hypothetical protein